MEGDLTSYAAEPAPLLQEEIWEFAIRHMTGGKHGSHGNHAVSINH